MNHLFLVKNEEENDIAKHIAWSQNISEPVFLSMGTRSPYFVNNLHNLNNISTWEEFGVTDQRYDRYWQNSYREIEGVIAKEIEKYFPKQLNNISLTESTMLFDIVRDAGNDFYRHIIILHYFFNQHCPKLLFSSQQEDFITGLLSSLSVLHGYQYENLLRFRK